MKIIKYILFVMLSAFSLNSNAELIPRIGVNIRPYYLEDFSTGESADVYVFGPTAGLLG